MDTAKDTADSSGIIKSRMYGYNYPPMPAAQVPSNIGYDQSSLNSNDGGSVNCQDSLWNVKHPNGDIKYSKIGIAKYWLKVNQFIPSQPRNLFKRNKHITFRDIRYEKY